MNLDAFTPSYLQRIDRMKWSVPEGSIGAWVAEMDFGIAPEIAAAMQRYLDAGALAYPTPEMDRELPAATAEWFADRYDWDVPVEQIVAISDVVGAVLLALRHRHPVGTPVVVPTPAYMPFLFVTETFGYPARLVPGISDDDGVYRLDLERIEDELRAGARVVLLTNPHNPVGRVYTRDELVTLSEVVEAHGATVFSDEIHAPLILGEGLRFVPYASISETAASHSITATAASKGWNIPGLKCAQLVVTSEADRAALRGPITGYYGHSASTLGYVASIAAYREARDWIDDVRAYLRRNAALLDEGVRAHLPGVRYTVPEGTYLGWLDCRELGLENPAAHFRKAAGVYLTDGALCGAPGFVRFNFAMTRDTLREATERMGETLSAR